MKIRRRQFEETEIPMGPMIDMVFLLLVFFMVTAKPIKQESDIALSLPGTASQDEAIELPDEQELVIDATGGVYLNEMNLAEPTDRDMTALFSTLLRFREASAANQTKPLVTIAADDEARHQRIVDVLNVAARAGITGITFADASGGEEE
jgi:biopolymer transport protein ExbD